MMMELIQINLMKEEREGERPEMKAEALQNQTLIDRAERSE